MNVIHLAMARICVIFPRLYEINPDNFNLEEEIYANLQARFHGDDRLGDT
jgi:hypothetical protein